MFLNFLEDDATQVFNICTQGSSTLFIFEIARFIITVIQVLVPFALIIWGSIDFFKALVTGDEKEMKQKRKPFVQRVIAAVVIIILPIIVNFIIGDVLSNYQSTTTFSDCWKNASDGAVGKFHLPGNINCQEGEDCTTGDDSIDGR